MTPQQLLGVGVRLFAVWLFLTSLAYFSSIPAALSSTSVGSGSATTVAFAIGSAYVLGSLVLWFFPMVVAHRLLPRTSQTNTLSTNAYELARVGCGLLGLWLTARALPTVVWLLFRGFLFVEAGSTFSSLPPESKLEVSVAFFEVLFGMLVVAKSGLFARAVVAPASAATAREGDL